MAAVGRARNPKRWLEHRRERRLADEWIAHGFASRYAWRVGELTSDRERRLLARELRSVVAEVRGSRLPGPAPLRGGALRPHVDLLDAIATLLAALDRPVAAPGVLAVRELLTSPGSVLYAPCRDCLPQLLSVLSRLEVS
jgi:hypothetical protein